jgi:glutaredoxin
LRFDYVYVDLLSAQEREDALDEVRSRCQTPSVSFPALMVDGRKCIVGYSPEKFVEVLGL